MKLGLITADLGGGDYAFFFVDEERWEAINGYPGDDDDPSAWSEWVWSLIEEGSKAPGRIVHEVHAQTGVLEVDKFPLECSLIGLLIFS
jgi:hypothetical protein